MEPDKKIPPSFDGDHKGSVYDVSTTDYEPSENKDDYESDISQRGYDQIESFSQVAGGGGDGGDGGEEGLPEGFEEIDVILCQNGAPVEGKILFKADEEEE